MKSEAVQTQRARSNRSTAGLLVLLVCLSFVSYLLRTNISVASEMMMPDLGLSKIQMGQIFSSFLIGYALFQSPAGAIGDIIGPRLTLGIAFLLWGLTTVATGLVPHPLLAGVNVTLVSLIIVRALLGASEAATFPVATAVVHRWMPSAEHAFGNSLIFMGSSFGAAVATPLVSWLMLKTGWRGSFYCTAILALLIAPVWFWYLKDFQADYHTADPTGRARPGFLRSADLKKTLSQMADKNILFLVFSYFSEGYVLFIFVFWLYIYLVEKRGFSILSGGIMSALPWLTACVMAPLGGMLSDRISIRTGRIAASRLIIAVGYVSSGLLLLLAAYSRYRSVSVIALCLSIGGLLAAEASFWTAISLLAGKNTGAISGVMNSVGVLGGIISTSLVPVLVSRFNWHVALGSGTLAALFCPFMWLWIRSPESPQIN